MRLLLAALVAAIVGLTALTAGAATYDNEGSPEGWAWARIRRDEVADINLRCDPSGKTQLDSHDDAGWSNDCRKIAATFITDILTEPTLRGQIKRHGMRLRGARIGGSLDLANADIAAEVWIDKSRIDGDLDLAGAHLARLLSLMGTRIRGDFGAASMTVGSSLFLDDGATFKGDVVLRSAKVEGQVAMTGSTFEKTVDADSMTVASSLFLDDGATFKGDVVLRSAKVGGQVAMTGSTFEGPVTADSMTVGSSLVLSNARFAAPLVVISNHVGGSLDLRGSVANRIDLSGTAVVGDLRIGGGGTAGLQWQCADTGAASLLPAAGRSEIQHGKAPNAVAIPRHG